MTATLLVHLTLDDATDVNQLAEQMLLDLSKDGYPVDSVEPWQRQQTPSSTVTPADIVGALPPELLR